MPVEHFKSRRAYLSNLAYRHIHGIPMTASKVCIGSGKKEKCHTVKHSKAPKRIKIDNKQRRKVARRKKESRKRG